MGSDSAKRYNEKRAKAAQAAIDKELDTGADAIDFDGLLKNDTKDAAMGWEHVIAVWIIYNVWYLFSGICICYRAYRLWCGWHKIDAHMICSFSQLVYYIPQ